MADIFLSVLSILSWVYGLLKFLWENGVYDLAKKKIPQLSREEIKFLMNAPDEVKSVEKKLKDIKSNLEKADFIRDKEEELDGWVSQLRYLAFVVDDVIEVFNNNKATDKGYDVFKLITGSYYQIATIHKLMKEVDDFNSKYAELSGEKPDFSKRSREDGEASNPLREKGGPSTETKEDDVVGFKEEEEQLRSWLTENDRQRLGWRVIVSIWGTAGAGKTSLAHKIYKNSSVTSQFDRVAWATVSQKCDVKDIWVAIIEQFGNLREEEKEKLKTEHIDIVRKKVDTCLKERDYLIILDDVWKGKDFNELMKAFPESTEKKCRILVTARTEEVGGLAKYRLPLQGLNVKEGEDMVLFLKRVYQSAPDEIQGVSEVQKKWAGKILEFCKGLPIAIVILGGMLRYRRDDTLEWRNLSERVQSELENSGEIVDIRKVIALSYVDLPYHLRSCFLYFGLFPEDSMIDCDKLIRLWLAERFLEEQGHNDDPMEYVAERCLDGLIQRSMIQVVQRKSNGKPQICCTHDLIQDFAKKEAEKTKLSSVSKKQPLATVEGIRRIAIHPKDTQDQIPGTSSSVPLQSKALTLSHPQSLLQPSRIKPHFKGDDDLVGFQEEVHEVEASLTNEEPLGRLAVVSIVGDSGIGKTAVARKVYNNVKYHFQCHAWVHIPSLPSKTLIKHFLCTILEQVATAREAIESKGVEDLQCMLHNILEGKSFLIVLDDLWGQKDGNTIKRWDSIKRVFPYKLRNKKCRILCTILQGSRIPLNDDVSVQLKTLNEDLSLTLFLKTIFNCSQNEIPKASLSKEMIDIARKMVKEYCGGFPFAILPLGSLLSGKPIDVFVWNAMLQSLNHGVGGGYGKVFFMCFSDLPERLKSCIRCFNSFPLQGGVGSDMLIQQWGGQGLLKSGDNKAIEDMGRDCLRVLIQRNLLDVMKWGSNGEPQTCILISQFRSFVRVELPVYEEIWRSNNDHFELEEGNDPPAHDHPDQDSEVQGTSSTKPPLHSQIRRFIWSHILSYFRDFSKFPNHVHSLLCFSKNPQLDFEQFPLLRVLDLEGAQQINELPNEVRKLTLLRYLSLRGTRVREIPRWIACLRNLQTLDAPTSKIPSEVLDLCQLRYLFADSFYGLSSATHSRSYSPESSSPPPRPCIDIGVLEHLHTLELDTADWIISGLDKLTNVRVLRLRGGDDSMFSAIAAIFTSLKSLSLTPANASSHVHLSFSNHSHESSDSRLDELILEGTKIEISRLEFIVFPLHLTYLWLEIYADNDVDPFSTLQHLLSLKKLCLQLFAPNSLISRSPMTFSKDGFPNLEYFYIRIDFSIECRVHWKVKKGALRNLRVLHIEGDDSLFHLPAGLRQVTTLKELIITRCYNLKRHLIFQEGKDRAEVAKIPSLSIKYLDESYMRP